jgi:GT2 family glycosyltransferase
MGFRAAQGSIVLFVDDDILCPRDLIRQHVQAHHALSGSVICGRCPFVRPEPVTPLFRFLTSLGHEAGADDSRQELVPIDVVSSGQISVERSLFDPQAGVYCDHLATPAAEEYELSQRLRQRGIPIFFAPKIVAQHDHLLTIDSMCRQAYKHALGCAEAAMKCPETNALSAVRGILLANGPARWGEPLALRSKKAIKGPLSVRPVRTTLLRSVGPLERVARNDRLLAPLYRGLLAIHMFAGVRDGLAQFAC